jgi:hypothetical protein
MDHDTQCQQHDVGIALLREHDRVNDATINEIADRVQLLVEQFHAQNVAQAEMRGDLAHIRTKVDEIETSLKKDFALRSEFVEVKKEWRTFLGWVLAAVVAAVLGALGWTAKVVGR